jgi:hypothetical protein
MSDVISSYRITYNEVQAFNPVCRTVMRTLRGKHVAQCGGGGDYNDDEAAAADDDGLFRIPFI